MLTYTSDKTFSAVYRIQNPNKICKVFFAHPSILLPITEIDDQLFFRHQKVNKLQELWLKKMNIQCIFSMLMFKHPYLMRWEFNSITYVDMCVLCVCMYAQIYHIYDV